MGGSNLRLRLYHFSAAQASGADAQVLRRRADAGMNRAQVDVPAPLAHVVGVTDGVSEPRPLAADITNSCHNSKNPSQADAESFSPAAKSMFQNYLFGGYPPSYPDIQNQDLSGKFPPGLTNYRAYRQSLERVRVKFGLSRPPYLWSEEATLVATGCELLF